MPTHRLTESQQHVYTYICTYIQQHAKAPLIREIQDGCRISSYKSAVDRLLALEKRGLIIRTMHKHRGIRVVPAAGLQPHYAAERKHP